MTLNLLLLLLYGVNVLERWLENSATYSSLLLVHVLSAFLIAGISFIGFLILFVAFHRE